MTYKDNEAEDIAEAKEEKDEQSKNKKTIDIDWANIPKLSDLQQDLIDAKPSHDLHKSKVTKWLDNLNVTGSAKVKTKANSSKVVLKLIRKQAEWRYSSLSEPFLSTDDVFKVRPVTWEDRDAAIQNELVLNNQFNIGLAKNKFIDDLVRAAVNEGTVIIRTGWEFKEEEYEKDVPKIEFHPNPAYIEVYQQIQELQANSPSQFATDVPEELKQGLQITLEQGVPYEPKVVGMTKEKATRTIYNRPTAEICNIMNVIIDPSCMGEIKKASFVIHSFESTLSDLKNDGKYTNLDNINVVGNSVLASPDHTPSLSDTSFMLKDTPRKKVVVYEYWGYWDIDKTGIVKPIVAAWVGDTMIRLEENPYPDKALPFILIPYLPVPRAVYGEPDGELLEDNQLIASAVARGMIDIMGKSASGQTGISKNFLDITNLRKYNKGEDYEFNPTADPRGSVHMHTYPEIPQSAQYMLQLQNMEAESLTGVKSFSSGVSGSSLGDVAAGVRGALDAASKRELGILRRLSDGIVEIGRKFIGMNAEFLSDEEVIRITNDDFVKIRRDDLSGNFDLKLSISTAEEDNNKAEQLAFMLQTMGNNMDPDLSKMILGDIATLRKMPDLAEKIRSYSPEPDPMAQKRAELELALLEAEVETQRSKAQEALANAQLAQSKAGTEVSKARNLDSQSDKTDLDFVEQESGVKQERDLQKQGEQARANAQLKQVEHAFKEKERKYDLLNKAVDALAKDK